VGVGKDAPDGLDLMDGCPVPAVHVRPFPTLPQHGFTETPPDSLQEEAGR
jgi:hypothetical protein